MPMHPFFSPLDQRELGLLLTTLTAGGSDQAGVFAFLPSPSRERVQQKAQALLQIPTEKRVPLMVRELKNALEFNGLFGIERMDPSWIVHGIKGESPRMVGVILLHLPIHVVRSILRRLPQHVRRALPPKSEIRNIPGDLATTLRQLFEARFAPMPTLGQGDFTFLDIIHLERQELYRLIRDLGLIELAQAFVSVGKMALLELCRRMPRSDAEELVQTVKLASRVDVPDPKSAQRFLSRVVSNFESTEEFLQKAGLWRLAKASVGESKRFRRAFGQRLPRRAGNLLFEFMERGDDMAEVDAAARQRLQDSVLIRVVLLSRTPAIAATWGKVTMRFHDANGAQAALAEAEAALPVIEADKGKSLEDDLDF